VIALGVHLRARWTDPRIRTSGSVTESWFLDPHTRKYLVERPWQRTGWGGLLSGYGEIWGPLGGDSMSARGEFLLSARNRVRVAGQGIVGEVPSHLHFPAMPTLGIGGCRRRLSSPLTSRSFPATPTSIGGSNLVPDRLYREP